MCLALEQLPLELPLELEFLLEIDLVHVVELGFEFHAGVNLRQELFLHRLNPCIPPFQRLLKGLVQPCQDRPLPPLHLPPQVAFLRLARYYCRRTLAVAGKAAQY